MIEKYVCAPYDLLIYAPYVNRLRFLLFTKSSDNKLRKFSPTKEALQLHILRSTYAATDVRTEDM